ncbi:MAG: iron ABC transporter permease [Verrucomicrobia bacterium]|nr:iron ABC transporter permease [Verrucomicrobiota bacterium]
MIDRPIEKIKAGATRPGLALTERFLAPFVTAVMFGYLGLFLIYPVWIMLNGAFSGVDGFSLQYFSILLSSPLIREACINSFLIALAATVVAFLLALPMAHIMTRYLFPGKSLVSALLLLPMVMPPFVGAIGLQQILSKYGVLNSFLMKVGILGYDQPIHWLGMGGVAGIVILQALHLYPILYLNLSASMSTLDPSLREAAQNMGASSRKILRTITLPLIIPGLFGGSFIVFIGSLTDLGTPLMFNFTRCIPVQIFDGISDMNTNPIGFTLVIFTLLVTALLFIAARALFMNKSYEVVSRSGHTGSFEIQASQRQKACFYSFFALIIFLAAIPNIMVVLQSFAGPWFMSALPERWTLENYSFLASHPLSVSSIRNSLYYSSVSGIIDVIFGVGIAWVITRSKARYGWLLDTLAMLPLALPGLVLAFGYMAAFDLDIPWLNPRVNPVLLLIVSYSVRRLPYMVRAACAGFQQASITLQEASTGLGASPIRTLRKITLPLILGHLIGGFILTFCFAVLEVSDSLILATREPFYPITKLMWDLISRIEPQAASYTCALGVLGMLILIISLWIASKCMGKKLGQIFRI